MRCGHFPRRLSKTHGRFVEREKEKEWRSFGHRSLDLLVSSPTKLTDKHVVAAYDHQIY